MAVTLTKIKSPRAVHQTDSSTTYRSLGTSFFLPNATALPLIFPSRCFPAENLNEQGPLSFLKDAIYGLIAYETGVFPDELGMLETEVKRKISLFGGKK